MQDKCIYGLILEERATLTQNYVALFHKINKPKDYNAAYRLSFMPKGDSFKTPRNANIKGNTNQIKGFE